MRVLVVTSDYKRIKDRLSCKLIEEYKLVGVSVLDCTEEDIKLMDTYDVTYTLGTEYKITEMPPPPIEIQPMIGARQILPDRLHTLTVKPLVDAIGYPALDTLTRPVCVLDTGINPDHVLFRANQNEVVSESVIEGEGGEDYNGHGSHVAGIIAVLAPYSTIVSIKVFPQTGRTSTEILVRGIEKAVEYRCYVINMSLGGYPSEKEINLMEQVLRTVNNDYETLLIAAMGNENLPVAAYPARSRNCIGVGSISDRLQPSHFSNKDFVNRKPDVTAFGERILSASHIDDHVLVEKTGTSMATPVVSAIAYNVLFFYEHAAKGGEIELLGIRLDGRSPPQVSAYHYLIELSKRNNPLRMYNTMYGHGITSFQQLTPSLIEDSFRMVRPPVSLPRRTIRQKMSQIDIDVDINLKYQYSLLDARRVKTLELEVGDIVLKYGWRIIEREDGIYVTKNGKTYRIKLEPVN